MCMLFLSLRTFNVTPLHFTSLHFKTKSLHLYRQFTPHHCTSHHFTSKQNRFTYITSVYSTSLHFTSLHSLTHNPNLISLACNYTLNPLSKRVQFTRGKTPVSLQVIGSSFKSPIYEGIFTNICSFFFPCPNFPIMILHTQLTCF